MTSFFQTVVAVSMSREDGVLFPLPSCSHQHGDVVNVEKLKYLLVEKSISYFPTDFQETVEKA